MNATLSAPEALLPRVVDIVARAGDRTLDFFEGDFDIAHKDDKTPVTDADHAADAVIVPALQALTPDVPVVSEERLIPDIADHAFWLVDPLDGTKEFIARRPEFTVNVALVERGAPVLGVVGVPAQGRIYAAAGPGTARRIDGGGAPEPIRARAEPVAGIVVAASRSHADKEALDRFLDGVTVADRIIAGSALKFCLVAEGAADVYPRLGPTMEWDTAAGHAVVDAAGGSVRTLDGAPLRYGKADFRNPHFVVRGQPAN